MSCAVCEVKLKLKVTRAIGVGWEWAYRCSLCSCTRSSSSTPRVRRALRGCCTQYKVVYSSLHVHYHYSHSVYSILLSVYPVRISCLCLQLLVGICTDYNRVRLCANRAKQQDIRQLTSTRVWIRIKRCTDLSSEKRIEIYGYIYLSYIQRLDECALVQRARQISARIGIKYEYEWWIIKCALCTSTCSNELLFWAERNRYCATSTAWFEGKNLIVAHLLLPRTSNGIPTRTQCTYS